MSVFLVILLGLSIAGWIWAGGLASSQSAGARLVLFLCGVSAVVGLYLLWTEKPSEIA
jgi:hypothetical protein